MTTEELIKALREKPSRDNRKFLDDVADSVELLQNAIFALNEELIAHKTEIKEQADLILSLTSIKTTVINNAKAEAVKEFAERVKVHSSSYTDDDYGFIKMVDKLVKVITEGKECTQCRYFVGCECFSGKVCDLFEEGKNDEKP